MSKGNYFVSAVIKTIGHEGAVSHVFHDLFVEGPWAIDSSFKYEEFKNEVTKRLNCNKTDLILLNVNLLHRPF